MPAPPPSAPPPGYYEQGTAPSAGWGAPGGEYQPPAQWRSLRGLTKALTVLFSIHIALLALMIIGVINHLSVLSDNERGGFVFDTDAVNDAQTFPAVMLLLAGLVGIATFVLLIIWLYRAAKNNEALGRQNPRLGPGWAIGGWFIPIAWWVIRSSCSTTSGAAPIRRSRAVTRAGAARRRSPPSGRGRSRPRS